MHTSSPVDCYRMSGTHGNEKGSEKSGPFLIAHIVAFNATQNKTHSARECVLFTAIPDQRSLLFGLI